MTPCPLGITLSPLCITIYVPWYHPGRALFVSLCALLASRTLYPLGITPCPLKIGITRCTLCITVYPNSITLYLLCVTLYPLGMTLAVPSWHHLVMCPLGITRCPLGIKMCPFGSLIGPIYRYMYENASRVLPTVQGPGYLSPLLLLCNFFTWSLGKYVFF